MKKLTISVSLIIGPVLFFGYLGKPTEMAIALFAGFSSAAILNLEKFNSFRAGELEATIRHAEEVINDANATIDQLKTVTEPLMNYLLAHIVRGDTVIGLNASDKEMLYLRLKENIETFDLQTDHTSNLLKEAQERIVQTSLYEVHLAAEQAAGGWDNAKPIHEVVFPENPQDGRIIPVDLLRRTFEEHPNLYNENVEQRLEEYERLIREYVKE